MTILNSMLIAFATYSRVPMPKATKWDENNMKYCLCFFPLIGFVIGGILIGFYYLCGLLQFNKIVFSAVASCLPMFITGGIHLDGFCDTIDALSSYQSKERRLEILKDSNAGAFAVIKCCAFYLLYFAVFTQLSQKGVFIVAVGYGLSRSLSGLAIANFKSARSNGMLATYQNASDRKKVTTTLLCIAIITSFGMMIISPIGIVAVIVANLTFIYYRVMSYKQFGGITGDIAGYFLELCEIYMAYSIIITEGVVKLWI